MVSGSIGTARARIDWGQVSLIATIPVTKHVKNKFDSAGHSQLLENSVDVVPYRVFLYFELLSNFAVLQAVGDEANHIFLATCQEWHSVGIAKVERFNMGESVYQMFEIFVAGPDLSPVDRLNALGEGFQGMTAVENTSRPITKSVHHTLGLGTLQEHDRRSVARVSCFLEDLDARFRAVLKLFADQRDICFVRSQFAYNLVRTTGQRFNREAFSAMRERIL